MQSETQHAWHRRHEARVNTQAQSENQVQSVQSMPKHIVILVSSGCLHHDAAIRTGLHAAAPMQHRPAYMTDMPLLNCRGSANGASSTFSFSAKAKPQDYAGQNLPPLSPRGTRGSQLSAAAQPSSARADLSAKPRPSDPLPAKVTCATVESLVVFTARCQATMLAPPAVVPELSCPLHQDRQTLFLPR